MYGDRVKVLVAIPAKDEELTIGTVVALSRQYGDVLVVDDGSSDNTSKVAELSGAKVLRHEINLGKAEALRSAFKYAIENGYDIVVCLDGDGQHDPDEIPRILDPIIRNEADLVIGSRFLRKNVPKYRVFGQKVLDVFTNLASEVKVTDSQSGFRALNRKALEYLRDLRSEGYSIESEMITFLAGKVRIKEVPINVRYDVPKKHKKNPLAHGLSVLSSLIGFIGYRRPLLTFGLLGFILTFTGLVFGFLAFSTYYATNKLPFGPSIASALFLILGLLLIIAGLILNSLVQIMKVYQR